MKSAIIGTGFAGQVHAAAIKASGAEIAVVIAAHEESAEKFAQQWGAPVYGTDPMLACTDDIDAVHICTPPATHAELVKLMLEHGKHVLCEKPLSFSAEDAAEIAAFAKEKNLVTALTFNVRYHMAAQRAKEIIASGELGRPYIIHGTYMQEFNAFPAPLDWRYNEVLAGEMRAVTEIGTHWFDTAEYISSKKIKAVSALFGKFNPERTLTDGVMYPVSVKGDETIKVNSEDAAMVTMKFEDGAIGTVMLSEISPGRGNYLSLEITCENGNLWWNEEDNNILNVAKKGDGIKREIFAFGNGFGDTFTDLVIRFYQAVAKGSTEGLDLPTFAEGAEIAKVCTAVKDSAENDSVWVSTK